VRKLSSDSPVPTFRRNASEERSSLFPAGDTVDVSERLRDEIDALLQNLSFFNAGNKSYVVAALQEILGRPEYKTFQSGSDNSNLFSFVIAKAESYCSVSITEKEIEAMLKSAAANR